MCLSPYAILMPVILGVTWCHDSTSIDWCTSIPVPFPLGFVVSPVPKSVHFPYVDPFLVFWPPCFLNQKDAPATKLRLLFEFFHSDFCGHASYIE